MLVSCLGHTQKQGDNITETEILPKNQITGLAALQENILTIINSSDLNSSTVGITILNLETGEPLFEHHPDKLFHPASTAKLYTTAAALNFLGPAYRFYTRVALQPDTVQSSTVAGDLWLIGSGDPTLTNSDLMALANTIKNQGISQINGNLVCDESAFDDIRYGKGWMWDDQPYRDFAPIGALSVNRNTLTVFISPGSTPDAPAKFRVDPPTNYAKVNNLAITSDPQASINSSNKITVLRRWQSGENIIDINGRIPLAAPEESIVQNIIDPAEYTCTLFTKALSQSGITVRGNTIAGKAPLEAQVTTEHASAQLNEIIIGMNKNSNNLDAELLLKAVGREVSGEQGSAENGIRAIEKFLTTCGLSWDTIRIADGSGVSRYNLVSPASLAALLKEVYNNFAIRHEFIASLPIAGIDGSLKNRMKGSRAATIVHAKTGFMTGVSSLAGYTQSLDGLPIAFVIMMEHFVGPHLPFQLAQDQICDLIGRYTHNNHPQ